MALILDSPITGKIISLEFKWLLKESSGSEVKVFYVLNQKCVDNWSGVCVAMTTGPGAVLQYQVQFCNIMIKLGKIPKKLLGMLGMSLNM